MRIRRVIGLDQPSSARPNPTGALPTLSLSWRFDKEPLMLKASGDRPQPSTSPFCSQRLTMVEAVARGWVPGRRGAFTSVHLEPLEFIDLACRNPVAPTGLASRYI